MKVHLSHDLENKRARAADRRGVSIEVLAREAIERVVNDDEWFIREVGRARPDRRRQVLTHEAVGARLARKLSEHDSRR